MSDLTAAGAIASAARSEVLDIAHWAMDDARGDLKPSEVTADELYQDAKIAFAKAVVDRLTKEINERKAK